MTQRFAPCWHKLNNLYFAHPRIAALLLGLMGATGFPPLELWPLTLLAMAGLIALLRQAKSARQAAAIGYIFGWAHLTLANNWIAKAFTFQAEMPAALGWIAVPLLCVYIAVYPAAAALGAHVISSHLGKGFVGKGAAVPTLTYGAIFAALWIITEWLRSWVFTGYPWPPLGLALLGGWDAPGFASFLPWLGTYALSGLAVLLSALLLWIVKRKRPALLLIGFAIVVSLRMGSAVPAPAADEQVDAMRYTLVQPNIPQEERDRGDKFEEHFARLARHTADESNPKRMVFWPESAVPDYLRDGYPQRYYNQMTAGADPKLARERIGRVIGEKSMLLFGVTDLEIGEKMGRRTAVGAYNTVTTMDAAGTLGERYSKAHLVPYGEYLALRWLLEPLGATRLVAGSIDFVPGPGPRTLTVEGYGETYGRAGIQICYEIVFSGQTVDRDNRPDYIFNPSNDGWFGGWGPPQHLGQARMRAIEEGLPVLRSTTDGISAVIDADGVVRQHIESGVDGSVSGFIPPAKEPTLFAKLGNALPLLWAGFLLIAALLVQLLATRTRSV